LFKGEIVKSVFQSSLTSFNQIHLESGAARIRNEIRIRILLKVSDPIGSGSTTLTVVKFT